MTSQTQTPEQILDQMSSAAARIRAARAKIDAATAEMLAAQRDEAAASRAYTDAVGESGSCSPDPGDILGEADGSEMDDCAICHGELAAGSICHWDHPNGYLAVAFTCGRACADRLEQKRGADGYLRVTVAAEVDQPFLLDDDQYGGDTVEAWYLSGPVEGITTRLPARVGVEYQHDALCYDVTVEMYDGSLTLSIEAGAFLYHCRRITGEMYHDDVDPRPAVGEETCGEPFQTDSDAFGDWIVLYGDRDAEGAEGPIVVPGRFAVGYDSRHHTYSIIVEEAEGQALVVLLDDDDWIALCGRMLGH